MRSVLPLTALAMTAFAANSLFARLALGDGSIDAASYTAVRVLSGALVLYLILVPGRRSAPATRVPMPGNWFSAAALFVYALAFSLAYLELGAATGALILFASVQATMIAAGLVRGDRPSGAEIAGFTVAFAAFIYLVAPGVSAPDPLGSTLMILSGVAWGVYSLRGRAASRPLEETAGNFVRAAGFAVPLVFVSLFQGHWNAQGVVLALASGILASGLGYAIWYRALPGLSTFQAALVQLSVPVIAAAGAIAVLTEPLSSRFAIACAFVLGGIAFALLARRRRS